MEKKIITISREFGSGGRSIGRMVAEKLGYKFYDQELILHVAKESGLAKEVVAEYEEYATHKNSFLYAIAMSNGGIYGGMSFANQVQIAQAKVINNLAEQGNCVIVGRGADYLLRERKDCLNVFIHADMKFRADRIVRLYGETNKTPEERLRDKDAKRKVYYKSFTMRDWGVCQNYHVSLDSSVVGVEHCVDIIVKIVEDSRE